MVEPFGLGDGLSRHGLKDAIINTAGWGRNLVPKVWLESWT